MTDKLEFSVLSGGRVKIDLSRCYSCETKACVKNCKSSKGRPVLVICEGLPVADFTGDELAKGACIECLACELDCNLHGNKAVTIELPIG